MDIISLLNILNAQDCLENSSIRKNWTSYRDTILQFLGPYPSRSKIIRLGGELSSIFSERETSSGKDDSFKTQSDASVSGNAWSRLVTWYLNICLIGTNCWAINNSNYIPENVRNAIRLSINNEPIQNSKETIIICYKGDSVPSVSIPTDINGIDLKSTYQSDYKEFFKTLKLEDLKVILLSIKTNCSDMIAIPLFWNFCYKGNMMDGIFDLKVGSKDAKPEMLSGGKVYYSIMTIPSGKPEKIANGEIPGQAALNKLKLLDAGFYWGRKSSDKVKSFENFISDNMDNMANDAGKMLSDNFEFINYSRSVFNKFFY